MSDTPDFIQPEGRLAHFPVTFFAVVMGLLGLTLALHAAEPVYIWAETAGSVMMLVSMVVLGLIALIYLAKALRYPAHVAAEWHHPVKLAFFPTITISLLLLATALHTYAEGAARIIWLVGMVGQGVLTIAVVSGWISHRSFEVGHLSPAWFIPAVGNVIVPIAGVRMEYFEISWLFFSGGLIFWIVLLTLVMNRLIFHDPIPARLFPTMVILIAPPAVAFVAYVNLAGEVDAFASILIYSAYVFAALVVAQVPKLASLPFALSWWALSFPLAALSIASFVFGRMTGSSGHVLIGSLVLLLLGMVVFVLVIRTVRAIGKGEICRPE